jgi:hypothetical protein
VPLYKRLVDPFTPEQTLWEFENIFVLAGATDGAWRKLTVEFDRLRKAPPDEAGAKAILERAREFNKYCEGFKPPEPKRAAPAKAAAD